MIKRNNERGSWQGLTNMHGNLKVLQKEMSVCVCLCFCVRQREIHTSTISSRIPVVKHLRLLKQTSGEACKRNFRPSQKEDHTIARKLHWKISRVYMLLPQRDTYRHFFVSYLIYFVEWWFHTLSCGWHYLSMWSFARLFSGLILLCLRLPTHQPAVF